MSGIFLSYRRDDSAGHAGRLYDRLIQHFGPGRVFRDVDSLSYGIEFLPVIREAIESCDALVAVIGRDWASVTNAAGKRRLDDPRDFVRLEIAVALERGMPVLPVLIEGATMPSEADLPLPLVRLSRYHALELSDSRWDYDVTRLASALERFSPRAGTEPSAPPPPPTPGPPKPVRSPDLRPRPRLELQPRTSASPIGIGRRWRVVVAIIASLSLLALVGVLVADGRGDGGNRGGDRRGSTSGVTTYQVRVPSTQYWTYAGFDVAVGDTIDTSASGFIYHDELSRTDADGNPDPNVRQHSLVKDRGHGALLARMGEAGEPFVLGTGHSFTAEKSGPLYFGINDHGLDNNRGEFIVKVDLRPG